MQEGLVKNRSELSIISRCFKTTTPLVLSIVSHTQLARLSLLYSFDKRPRVCVPTAGVGGAVDMDGGGQSGPEEEEDGVIGDICHTHLGRVYPTAHL